LLGGVVGSHRSVSTVQLVDLATGTCTLQTNLLLVKALTVRGGEAT